MSDIESIDNSTDDPDYAVSDQEPVSSSDSGSDDFVAPQKKHKQLKKRPQMSRPSPSGSGSAPAPSGSASSPGDGATFNLTQIAEEYSQESVLFKKCFDDLRPGRHVFVTGEGKIARSKRFSLRENGFILVFSTSADWTAFTEAAVDSSVSADRIYREHSAVEVDSKDKLNKLLWVNPDSLNEDIDINTWYKLVELYTYPGLSLTGIFKKNLETPSVIESKESAESAQSEPKPAKSSKFNFKLLDKNNADFIEENMSPSTLKVTRVAVTLFDKFMKQAHPELLHATLATAEESRLPELLSEFFKVLQKNEGESYNATTLQTYYLALGRFLKQKRNIVMKNNPVFEQTRDVLSRQQRISCKNGQRPGRIFTDT